MLVFTGISRGALQARAKGARIGISHPLMQPLPCGLSIQAINPVGVLLFQRQRKRPLQRAGPQNPVTCQPGKPQ